MSATAEEIPPIAAAEGEHAAPAAGKGKFKIIAVIAAVMLVEGIALYMLIPRGSAAASAEEGSHGEEGGDHDGHGGHGNTGHGGHGGHGHGDAPKSDTVEMPIESVMTTNNRASPGSIIHMSFKLVAIVSTAQKGAFEMSANGENKARVRQAILKVARSSNMEEISDPELSTMKRLFREEINKVLKKSYVIEVVISDFKTLEQ